ncbi:MAG: ATP-binding cassette domain-containing protein [Actinobacteria bacterium]|nr:ATP-binding cassette domain-containing protein [Actinomycetota bacterium]
MLADLNRDPAAQVIGIVGPSGGGKSTLVQLLLGLRRPDSGDIYAADRSLSRCRAEGRKAVRPRRAS